MNQKFVDFMQPYLSEKIAVAVSGGVDSVCLLHWLKDIGADIVCLHVNHGLRAAADSEEDYVREICDGMRVPFFSFHWTDEKPASNLEAAARDARYGMMTAFCRENGIKNLAVAHQADDQIETFLMNLARGSGLAGLAAMRGVSVRDGVRILRPLLGVHRAELVGYCTANGIRYFSDEMNEDAKYTRVRMRQNRHLLSRDLGISDARILLAIENLGRMRDAMDADIESMVQDVTGDGYAMFSDSFLFDLPADIGLKLLGTLIQKIGGDRYRPRLDALRGAMVRLGADCKFTLGHCTLRRLRGRILIVPEGAKTTFRKRNGKEKKKCF